jgi:AcrR family transcriptional regulator
VRSAVLAATFEELADVGYGEFSIERVAERAGVNKTTVYRRWENKENLILEAMLDRADDRVAVADTGSLRSDLAALGKILVADLRDPAVQATARTAASISDRDSDIARASRRFWGTWLGLAGEIIGRAVRRGEAAPVDAELLLDAIAGPILFRLLLSDEPLDDPFVEHLAQLVSAGATANGSRR